MASVMLSVDGVTQQAVVDPPPGARVRQPGGSDGPRQKPAGRVGGSISPPVETAGRELTPEEKQRVRELQETDRRVRAHERAHIMAAGPYAEGSGSEAVGAAQQ